MVELFLQETFIIDAWEGSKYASASYKGIPESTKFAFVLKFILGGGSPQ